MSVDDRIRSALREQADVFDPSPEIALLSVRNSGRRARWGAASVAAAAAAVVVVAGVAGWNRLQPPAGTGPADQPTSASDPATTSPPLRGLVRGDVTKPPDLAGHWALRLNGNGSLDVEPPAAFAGELAGALFTADGDTFRTTLFQRDRCLGEGTGIYTWLAVGDRIAFEVVSDPCRARARFFEESDWTVSTGDLPGG